MPRTGRSQRGGTGCRRSSGTSQSGTGHHDRAKPAQAQQDSPRPSEDRRPAQAGQGRPKKCRPARGITASQTHRSRQRPPGSPRTQNSGGNDTTLPSRRNAAEKRRAALDVKPVPDRGIHPAKKPGQTQHQNKDSENNVKYHEKRRISANE